MQHVVGMGLGAPLWDVVKCPIARCGKAHITECVHLLHRRELCSAAPLQEVANYSVTGCGCVAVQHVAGMGLGAPLWDVVKLPCHKKWINPPPISYVVLHVAGMCEGAPLWDVDTYQSAQ